MSLTLGKIRVRRGKHDGNGRCRAGYQMGIVRFMNPSKSGTVKAVSPCAGLKTMPFVMSAFRTGATVETF
jgi:hypothetical protein